MSASSARKALFLIFTLSGFAGLIYESIWSHYLKLLLGHAAYAQTLVLVLFMGGMAMGSWVCSRASARMQNPLLAYAVVELVLGVFALGFDPVFRGVAGWMLDTAAPALAQPLAIEVLKWTLAALLILPACVLLGATFPLISAGVVRLAPQSAGNALGWLYFTNSLGAVVGVLASGFVLIALVGLPGTLLTAGLCNFLLALIVYGLAKRTDVPALPARRSQLAGDLPGDAGGSPASRLLLLTAFLTGAASFFYEIGWIRMLSLVLGSATHSFELMLGAFILGLALGALWIRNRVDGVANPLRTLAWVQVLMGTAALVTLVVYGWSFEWMGAIVRTLAKTETGFTWFNLLSQAVCWALMLPVTFLAGMTLPLITALLLRSAVGEAAIGRVYAANTLGAIVGVVLAVNLVMPYLGLRNVVVVGAAIDLLLGLWLFSAAGGSSLRAAKLLLAACVALAVGIAAFTRFDPAKLASGVYRYGVTARAGENVWRRDGRTASINVDRNRELREVSIMTNGKPDAALLENGTSRDDFTMILTGVLPLALKPDAKTVAVIGMGSGRSTHIFLGSPTVESVETIEIEPAMVEGARLFGPLVERTFKDPRSHIRIEDAKTFFARHQKRYDIIMSEPSNPWVSGVASLFSQEFYRQIKRHLSDGGVFVQWLQLYEFNDALFASVLHGLGEEFESYAIYAADDVNVLIAAVPRGRLNEPDASVLALPGIQPLAGSIGVRKLDDLRIRHLGSRTTLDPWVSSIPVPVNSDYFPFLDQNAAKARFMQSRAMGFSAAHPVTHRIEGTRIRYGEVTSVTELTETTRAVLAHGLWAYLAWKHGSDGSGAMPPHARPVLDEATRLDLILSRCELPEVETVWQPSLERVGLQYLPYLDPENAAEIVAVLRRHVCNGEAAVRVNAWLGFFAAVGAREWSAVSAQGTALLGQYDKERRPPVLLVREVLLADYMSGGRGALQARLRTMSDPLPQDASIAYLRAISGVSPTAAAAR